MDYSFLFMNSKWHLFYKFNAKWCKDLETEAWDKELAFGW